MADQIATKSVEQDIDNTIQARVEEYSNQTFTISFTRNNTTCELIPSLWWSEQREYELQQFWMARGNDILQSALSSFVKKFKSMNYTITGPEKLAKQCMQMVIDADFGKGLSEMLGKTVLTFLTSDKGAFWEIIGTGNIDEPVTEVLGIALLDNRQCVLTKDVNYPVIFTGTKDNKARKMHRSRVYHFVDMPSPNTAMNNTGFCSVSRVSQASSIMLKLSKYKDEKISDLPEAGLLLFNNVLPTKWDERVEQYETDREQKGQEYWNNLITLFGLDPTRPATAQFISFANTPDNFNELQQTEMYINLLALSLGISPNEIWSLSTGTTWNPTATEATIQHQQAKNKGVGDLITAFERALNWAILPANCKFQFDYVDDMEDKQATEINYQKIEAIMKMWAPPDSSQIELGVETVVPANIIRQLLANEVSWFDEAWLDTDISDNVTITEIDTVKQFGPVITINKEGRIQKYKSNQIKNNERGLTVVMKHLEQKYKNGEIGIDELLNFRMNDLIDKEIVTQ